MKIIVLLFAMVLGFFAICKDTARELQELGLRNEVKELRVYPNLLPVVEVVATPL
ncbi:hypothetical protein [Pontibacter harenae]|uniref:hypothetical protein n=1 Tax=Pontibacter harenae TaxID=2894083 RepID=UPI001E4493BB|nr:hypothetical protein [Pontibacter harenae]MCC9167321.1 hypothetical protein [Pontibacter harenae]